MLLSSTIQLLRFHFSLFLLPVFLFGLSQVQQPNWNAAALIFFILHLMVYPASNGYNSYMDRDTTPIGGLARPQQPTQQLLYTTIIMDGLALILSLLISSLFALGILLYIMASRAYSYRGIRLKRYPLVGFFTVFLFQGALVFWLTYHGVTIENSGAVPLLPCFISSCLIGALYPLTQVYQHAEDKLDGVRSISILLGRRGTFIFSGAFFVLSASLLFIWFQRENELNLFYLFLLVTLPSVVYFLYWMRSVYLQESAADFKNSLRMNLVATCCTVAYFTTLIILKH